MALPNYGWGVALYNGPPVELDFVLPNIRSQSPGGKLPDPLQARVVKGDDAKNTLPTK